VSGLRLRHLLPLAVFALLALALFVGMSLNPREIPSALIDRPVPDFALPPVKGRTLGLASGDLRQGEVVLVNVFASWCAPCRAEHPLFTELARKGEVKVHGLNYKDEPEHAAAWLDRLGDPYTRTGADLQGRVSIDWGVYGVPETFVVTGDGRIACKHIGPVMAHDLETKLLPLVRDLRERGRSAIRC
jgi:cytochrome c biogenesis protein CcmG/thiol:disulfide interchange protein DsbE